MLNSKAVSQVPASMRTIIIYDCLSFRWFTIRRKPKCLGGDGTNLKLMKASSLIDCSFMCTLVCRSWTVHSLHYWKMTFEFWWRWLVIGLEGRVEESWLIMELRMQSLQPHSQCLQSTIRLCLRILSQTDPLDMGLLVLFGKYFQYIHCHAQPYKLCICDMQINSSLSCSCHSHWNSAMMWVK